MKDILSVLDVVRLLECRICDVGSDLTSVQAACRPAIAASVPAVLCRPDQVPNTARALAGHAARIVTSVDFRNPGDPDLTGARLRLAATRLVEWGAHELGLTVTPKRIKALGLESFVDDLRQIGDVTEAVAGHSRVAIDGTLLRPEMALRIAQRSADAGVRLIQCGSVGTRARLGLLSQLRQIVGPGMHLKWTPAVRNLDVLLIALAEGADRFEGHPGEIHRQAEIRHREGGIRVPVRGRDY